MYEDIDARLEAATSKAENASGIIHDVANGAEGEFVTTENGQVPTIPEFLKQLDDEINTGADSILTGATQARDDAEGFRDESEQFLIQTGNLTQEVSDNKDITDQNVITSTEQATIATEQAQIAFNSASKIGDVTGGMVVNRLDANGNQNVMYKIPMFTNKIVNDVLGTNWLPEEAPHPGFIRPDGTTMPWFEVGMYVASNDGSGNPVSAPFKRPFDSQDFDTAKAKCQSMGDGWGLMTNAQWAAIALWCLMNEYQPTGNTYYGQSHEKKHQTSIRQDGLIVGDASGTAQNLTGTGAKEWNHNNSAIGIADLVGNIWEWVDGLKIVDGQIIVSENNDPIEANWIAQAAYLDDGLKLNSERLDTTSTNVTWASLGKSETYISNQLLQQLMIETITETGAALGRLYYNNDGERLPVRGGGWGGTSVAGVAALGLSNDRALRSASRGFRPAYFE